jgi:hypothetical protein
MLRHKTQCRIEIFDSFQNLTYILLMDINSMGQDLYFGKEIGQINYTEQKIYPPKTKFCFKLAESTVHFISNNERRKEENCTTV